MSAPLIIAAGFAVAALASKKRTATVTHTPPKTAPCCDDCADGGPCAGGVEDESSGGAPSPGVGAVEPIRASPIGPAPSAPTSPAPTGPMKPLLTMQRATVMTEGSKKISKRAAHII